MKPGTRIALLATIATAVLLGTSACSGGLLSGGSGGSSADSGPIKLGMLIPQSGSSAPSGAYMKNGARMAVDEINKDGGVLGRKLQLLTEDDGCDPQQAVAAANKAVSSGADISVGGYCSGATLPTLPIFNKANVPMIIPVANSEDLVNQKLDNVFLINGTGKQQSAAAVKYIDKQHYSKIALADDNTSYSKDITTETASELKDDGTANVVLNTSVTAGESDYSALVRQVVSAAPDLFYWTGYYQEAGLIINQLHNAGYKGKVMVADGSVDPSLVKIAGADSEGVLATMTPTPDTLTGKKAKTWIADYTKKFGAAPGPYSTQSYDAVRLAAHAISKAKSTDSAKVIEALKKVDGFEMFSGPLKFTDEHTLSAGGFQILQVQNGKFVLKDPLS